MATGNRILVGDSPIVTMFLAGCYTICTVTALIMGFDGYLVLAAGTFLGGLVGWEIKNKLDTKIIRRLQRSSMDNLELSMHLQEQLKKARSHQSK